MRTKWKWIGLMGAAAAALGYYVWCSGTHHDDRPGEYGDRTGSDKDAHDRMCAQRHKPFLRSILPKVVTPSGDKRGSGYKIGSPDNPGQTVKTASVAPPLASLQPLVPQPQLDTDPLATVTGDCPVSICGLNGTWLGSGVPFRTLHLSPYRHNEANLSILGFQGPAPAYGDRESLTLKVDGDLLHAENKPSVEKGSRLLLGPAQTPGSDTPSTPTYELTITDVETRPFLVGCSQCARQTYHVYQFSARSLADDCSLEVCEPGLDDGSDSSHNLVGKAVIFRGDFYEPAYTVKTTPATNYDDDVFNIACVGTTISKLHLLRQTSASQGQLTDPLPPPVDKRQAMLRMLTADYCGAGHPFTQDGTPIRIELDGAQAVATASSLTGQHFDARAEDSNDSIDALWTGDGAACIGTPRLLPQDPDILDKIKATCSMVNHPLETCANAAPSFVPQAPPQSPLQLPLNGYVISLNPGS